jgi:hypothetical protein
MISGCYDFFCRIDCSDRPRSSIKRYNIYCSWASAIILSVAFTGCGADEESAPSDAASDAGELSDSGQNRAALVCVNDNDCSDSLYCNGTEYCSPTNPQADEMGCVGGESPCLATQTCEEEEKRCVTQCTTERDADGDGYQAIECGGDDCDDSDADRFPGNEELCDATHDEDCDPTTFGQRDWDEDGFTDALCCNEDEQGEKYCGDDCNDFDSTTHPMATEVCDEIDNDCDSETDEDKRIDGFEDNDRDRHGNPDKPMQACAGSSGFSEKSDDCDDEQPTVHAAQQEFCDEIDNDCRILLSLTPLLGRRR